MKKIVTVLPIITVLLTFGGCSQPPIDMSQTETSEAIETPTPTPIDDVSPTPDPITDTIEEEISDDNPKDALRTKLAGVWGNLEGGCYFENYNGDDISSGWFESDALPNAHISSVEELSKDKYHVVINVDQGFDEDGETYDGYTYEATYDGSGDGFKTYFIASTETKDYLYMRLGQNMDEAWDYYCKNLVDDYRKLEEEHKKELRDSPVGQWFTEGYDEIDNWAGSYYFILNNDGTALCKGWRNNDTGTYEIKESGKVIINFDHCEYDDPAAGGWVPLEGFVYSVEMQYSGKEATIKIDAPDVVSNLMDGRMHRD